MRKQETCQQ